MRRLGRLTPWLSTGLLACGGGEGSSPAVRAEPARLDFGAVPVGSSQTAELALVRGAGGPVLVERLEVDAALREAFAPVSAPRVLASPRTAVEVEFRPTRAGAWAGALRVELDPEAGLSPVVVPVSGLGTAGGLAARPEALDFGRLAVGTSTARAARVENAGAGPVELRALVFDGQGAAAFSGRLGARRTLRPGETERVSLRFSPPGAGAFSAVARVATAGAESGRLALSLRGEGRRSAVGLEPSERLGFGAVFPGERSRRVLRVRNLSFARLPRVELSLSGAAAAFSVAPASFPLAPGEERDVDVVFAPGAPGQSAARLRVRAGPGDAQELRLEGEALGALAPRPRLLGPGLDFGPVRVGEVSVRYAWLTVEAGPDLTAGADIGVAPASAPFRVLGAPLPVPGGTRRRLEVEMRPVAPGRVSAVLEVGTATLALSGAAVTEAAPSLQAWPPVLDFGRVPRGAVGRRRLALRSVGSVPLRGLTPRVEPPFRVARGPPGALPPGASPPLFVEVEAPTRLAGALEGTLSLAAEGGVAARVPLRAEIVPLGAEVPPLEVRLEVGAGAQMDLHLALGEAPAFSVPGDACFCNPHPDWGTQGDPSDDPRLLADLAVGPGEERVTLPEGGRGTYRVEVVHTGGADADAVVEVRVWGVRLARVRRRLGASRRWTAGAIRPPGAPVRFEPADLPLAPEPRRHCD